MLRARNIRTTEMRCNPFSNTQFETDIEDFIKHMVPCADPVWPLAEKYIGDIPADARRFASRKTSKAEIHAWLATREKPGRMGAAIGCGDLQTGGSLCADFLKWIGDLFK